MLLEGENNGEMFLFVDVNGEGCLRMASKARMRRDALHAVEDVW